MRTLKRSKKGLSTSIETVLIMLITIAIVGVVAYFAFHYISAGSSSGNAEIVNPSIVVSGGNGYLSFSVENNGATTINQITVSVYGPSGPSTISGLTCGGTAASSGSNTVSYTLSPSQAAQCSATIANAVSGTQYSISVQVTTVSGSTLSVQPVQVTAY